MSARRGTSDPRGAGAPGGEPLRAPRLGLPRVHYRLTDSTNARARELGGAGAPHGTVVTAHEQSAGRGRQGRTWTAPAGRALLCSVVVRRLPRLLPMVAGLAVADTVGPQAALKWPNDVLVEERKVAGILAEGRPQEGWAVVGIGLNVAIGEREFPPELQGLAATMGLDSDHVEPVLGRLLAALEGWLEAEHGTVLNAVRARDALAGRRVAWDAGEGEARGIDGDGRLIVVTASGRVALEAGEVHLRR